MRDASLVDLLALTLPASRARAVALVLADAAGKGPGEIVAVAGSVPDEMPTDLLATVAAQPATGFIPKPPLAPSAWFAEGLVGALIVNSFGEPAGAICALGVDGHREPAAVAALDLAVGHVERALDRDEEQLHLRDLSRNLARSEAALTASNRDLERFAFFAAHELQAPLRAVEAFAEVLAEAPDDPRVTAAAGSVVRREAAHMRSQVEGLLTLSRVSALELDLVPVALSSVVASVVDRLGADITNAGAAVTVGDVPSVLADVPCMEIVFTNVLANALRYRDPRRPSEISVTSQIVDADTVVIEVRDNGVGMADEDVERVFEAFQRVSGTDVAGVGLGLTLTRRIVDQCGGAIAIESSKGEGTVVSLTLLATTTEGTA